LRAMPLIAHHRAKPAVSPFGRAVPGLLRHRRA
jgi:hypothetical protein